ncbi:MAG: hypothetical protein IJY31_06520 [Muribaculaceae bacterium]|nr:hypothetical protein [Muribaculaceae bacterium]
MFFYDKFKKNKCLYISLLIYHIFNTIDFWGDYKINIVVVFYKDYPDYGHAWVTRNGRKFLLRNKSIDPLSLEQLGMNKKYRYWVNHLNIRKYMETL